MELPDFRSFIWLVVNQPDEAMALAKENPDLLLLRSGLDETPLHFLVVENHLMAVARLIAVGASVQVVNFVRSSPLVESVKLGYLEMSRLLLEHGADPTVMNNMGETALSVAARKGDDALFSLLLTHCPGDINDYFGDIEAMGLLARLDDPLEARCRALGLKLDSTSTSSRGTLSTAAPKAGVPRTFCAGRCGPPAPNRYGADRSEFAMRFTPVFPGLFLLFVVFADATALDISSLRDPRPARWSLDHSGQLDQRTLNALDELGQRVRSNTGHELVVVAVTSTDGESQRTLGLRLFNHWEIGNRARHDGVLLFVALGDRGVEFILGDGVDENRHVAISQEIVDQDMVPRFRSGDPDGAVLAGARAAARRLLGLPDATTAAPIDEVAVSVQETPHIAQDPVRVQELTVELDPATATSPRPTLSPTTTYPVSERRQPETGWGWFDLSGAGGGGVVGFLMWRRWLRNRPRTCDRCQQPMERLGDYEEDQHLNHSEKTEEKVGSVDYDIWCCTACPHVLKLRYGTWFTSYARCPGCHAVTKSSNQTTLVAASYDHGGQVRVDEACAACNYRNSFTRSTPRKTLPKSGNRSSFGGGDFGGGRSNGGGGGRASGRGGGGSW